MASQFIQFWDVDPVLKFNNKTPEWHKAPQSELDSAVLHELTHIYGTEDDDTKGGSHECPHHRGGWLMASRGTRFKSLCGKSARRFKRKLKGKSNDTIRMPRWRRGFMCWAWLGCSGFVWEHRVFGCEKQIDTE